MSQNTRAAFLMMASMAAFTINDAFIKAVLQTHPLFQVITIRGVIASVLIYLMARQLKQLDFRFPREDWLMVVVRCASEIGATYFFLTALSHMPLANLSAVLQVLPLTVTLGAVVFFGERIGWRRALAIGMGFCGVMLIIRPGTDGFSIHSVYALAAVACVTVRDLSTRRMSGSVPSLTVTFLAALAVLLFAGIGSTTIEWQPMAFWQFGLITSAALFIIAAYHFSVAVMRVGEVSFVAPFRYTSLLWALLLGWVVFGDWPDLITLIGGGIVVVSGLFMFYRERVKS